MRRLMRAIWCEAFHYHFRIIRKGQQVRLCWDCDRLDKDCPGFDKWTEADRREIREARQQRRYI